MYLRIHVTVVSSAATAVQYTQFLDTGNNVTTAGTALTKVNTNPLSSAVSNAQITVGANVRSLANNGSLRVVGHCSYRGTIDVVQDTYGFYWGTPDVGASGVHCGDGHGNQPGV